MVLSRQLMWVYLKNIFPFDIFFFILVILRIGKCYLSQKHRLLKCYFRVSAAGMGVGSLS